MLLGVGLFSAITAIITSSLVSARGPEGPDAIASLERLARLHESGALRTEEFEATKARLLARV